MFSFLQGPQENVFRQISQLFIGPSYTYHKVVVAKNPVDIAIYLSDRIFHINNLDIVEKFLFYKNYPNNFVDKHIHRRLKELQTRDQYCQ